MHLSDYNALIAAKRATFSPRGFTPNSNDLPAGLFDHQAHGVDFALRTGCSALFYDTGLGKTAMALAWGDAVVRHTNRPVLMLAPLAVGKQHQREAERMAINAIQSRDGSHDGSKRIIITNYERLSTINIGEFGGVILDESSIMKSFTGMTTRALISSFSQTKYRLCASATPAPNDHTELGSHSEFLSALDQNQMLQRWFLHDSADTGTWRMKGHAVKDFWDWVSSWARCVSKPSDLGFSDAGFDMPELIIEKHIVTADRSLDLGMEKNGQNHLFRMPDTSATAIHKEKRITMSARAEKTAEIVLSEPTEPWIVWVDTDYDADEIMALLPDAVEVRGNMSADMKEERLTAFSDGKIKILVTKAQIAGYGLNWQHCARMAFMGINFSYERYYQAIRRCWRFRQSRPVHVHVVCADTEASIWDIVSAKQGDHDAMKSEMSAAMARAAGISHAAVPYLPTKQGELPPWLLSA